MYQKLQTGRATAMAELLSDTIDNVNLNNVAVSSAATPGSGGTVLVDTSLDTGVELITNGDFLATGSNLVSNPNFTDTGSELVTNGDFSATGSELVTNGNFATDTDWTVIAPNVNISDGKLNFVNAATNTDYANQTGVATVGKSYKVTIEISDLVVGDSVKLRYPFQDTSITTNGTHTLYGVAESTAVRITPNSATGTFSVNNVSVKELGEDWTDEGSSTISIGTHAGRDNVADISITGTSTADKITQPFTWTAGKSYKVVVEVYVVSGSFRIDTLDSYVFGDFVSTSTTGSWQTLTGYITATSLGGSADLFLRGMSTTVAQFYVDSVSIKELGEDWTVTNADATHYVEFVETGARYYSLDAGVDALSLNQLAIPISGYGKSYKLTCTCTFTSGTNIRFYSGSLNVGLLTEGVNTLYFVADSNQTIAFIRNTNTLVDVTISSISVQELGGGWEELSSDPDSVSFGENGVKIVQSSDLGNENRVYQTSVTQDDKSYKVTYTIHSISLTSGNSVKYYNGSGYIALPEQDVGTHTFTYTRQGANGSWYFNLATPVNSPTDFVTISYISVEESENAGFVPLGVQVGDIVYNTASIPNVATVVGISPDGDTLTLSNDISVTSGVPYKILSRTNSAATLYIGTVGTSATLKVRTAGGDDVTLDNLVQGTTLPTQVVRVYNTGTANVSNIIALF